MPYLPRGAQDATASAEQLRRQYRIAVVKIREARHLSEPDKRRQLKELHAFHSQRMQELREQWNQAFFSAEYHARKKLASDKSIRQHRITSDSYLAHLERLSDKDTAQLEDEYRRARLLDDDIVMRAVAFTALGRRMPGPGDPATRLVARFANEREPDGHGGTRYMFPEAKGAWDDLRGIEAWDATDRAAAVGVFSVPSTPEPPKDPQKRADPAEEARQAVAALYPTSPGATLSNGQAQDEPASP